MAAIWSGWRGGATGEVELSASLHSHGVIAAIAFDAITTNANHLGIDGALLEPRITEFQGQSLVCNATEAVV